MKWLKNWLYDWWNARKLEQMRLGAAFMHICLTGEVKSADLRAKLKTFWFGERMTCDQWLAVTHRLEEHPAVKVDERWVQEEPHLRSHCKFYSVPEVTPASSASPRS
jgi:hypothetical protein